MPVRLLTRADDTAYLALRLEALEREPLAFPHSLENEQAVMSEALAARLTAVAEGSFVLGAFVNATLVGMVTLDRDLAPKVSHKAYVRGLYVSEGGRGQGLGRTLMAAVIAHVSTYTGLEKLMLGVATTQTGARTLYCSLGFEPFGLERRAWKVSTRYVDEEYFVLWLER